MRNRVAGPDAVVSSRLPFARGAALLAIGAGLAACTSSPDFASGPPAATVAVATINAPAVVVEVNQLPGKWGLASYRKEEDRARTIVEAKSSCGNPYQIGPGAQGGIVMHLADQPQPTEVFVKVTPDGRSFIGPRGAAGLPQDRVVMSFDNSVLITEWIDPSARERYGTMVFVRCGGKARA